VAGEGEIAITLTESVLVATGADPALVASVRDGVRASLGG